MMDTDPGGSGKREVERRKEDSFFSHLALAFPFLRGEAYALSVPPVEYGRKTEKHGNWGAPAQAAEHVA